VIALTTKQKLAAAGAASAALALAAVSGSSTGLTVTTGARLVLGLLALAGLATWLLAQRGLGLSGKFAATPRLQLVQRIGLSARSGVALVEVDGRSFLIVHGDGGTRIRRVSSRAAVLAQQLKKEG
jgi:hypothetical protein